MWITIRDQIIGWLVVCNNSAFKELLKIKED
jgi:hypothetical protein